MGNFLDTPIVEKETEVGEGQGLQYGLSSMQGWRAQMEDDHIQKIELSDEVCSARAAAASNGRLCCLNVPCHPHASRLISPSASAALCPDHAPSPSCLRALCRRRSYVIYLSLEYSTGMEVRRWHIT